MTRGPQRVFFHSNNKTFLLEQIFDPLSYPSLIPPFSKAGAFGSPFLETTFPELFVMPCISKSGGARGENRRYAYHDANIR